MNQEDVDNYYDEQKDRLMEEYQKDFQKSKKKEKAKKKYLLRMTRLHRKYELLSNSKTQRSLSIHKVGHFFRMILFQPRMKWQLIKEKFIKEKKKEEG